MNFSDVIISFFNRLAIEIAGCDIKHGQAIAHAIQPNIKALGREDKIVGSDTITKCVSNSAFRISDMSGILGLGDTADWAVLILWEMSQQVLQ